eukprot:2435570-Pyramimonas_sp.AAC.1
MIRISRLDTIKVTCDTRPVVTPPPSLCHHTHRRRGRRRGHTTRGRRTRAARRTRPGGDVARLACARLRLREADHDRRVCGGPGAPRHRHLREAEALTRLRPAVRQPLRNAVRHEHHGISSP